MISTTLKPNTLALFDKAIAPIQDALKANLIWLDHSFGKAQKLVKTREGRNYFYPGVHYTADRYLDLSPGKEFGNYSFFILDPDQDILLHRPNNVDRITADCSIVFWVDLDSIYGTADREIERLKIDILNFLVNSITLTNARLTINKIQDQAEDIFDEFSLQEVDTQFLMEPYCGLRFSGKLELFNQFCDNADVIYKTPRIVTTINILDDGDLVISYPGEVINGGDFNVDVTDLIPGLVILTQIEYDLLDPKNPTTYYLINNN